MKRIGVLLLALVMCLICAALASAETSPVAQSGAVAAYIDGKGGLFLPGKAEAVNQKSANSIVSVDNYRVLFLSPGSIQGTDDLYMIELQSLKESLLASDVHTACAAGDDTAYCVLNSDRARLTRIDLTTLTAQTVYTAAEPIDRLYASVEGLVVQLVDQAGALLYVEDTGRFDFYTGDIPRRSLLADGYEVYLTGTGDLYMKSGFNYAVSLIDSDVLAYTRMNGRVYYLCFAGSAVRLKAYSPAGMTQNVVMTPGVKLQSQLTASAGRLFLLGTDNSVYSVDAAKGTMTLLSSYADLSSYGLPSGYECTGLRIEGMSGQLNVYAQLKEASAKPDFSFIEFETESETADAVYRLIDKKAVSGEQTAWDILKPAAQYTPLSRGSRGDAVRAIQQPLYDLGYYDYYVDGIYGSRTEYAVRLLQSDLELPVTGTASADLQRTILSGRLSPYDRYVSLLRGDRGLRVTIMQERLRELGYLADAADGIFGPRTLKAVQLFQSENGLAVTDSATRATLKLLYSDRADSCSSYIDLYPGDTGYRVRELNNRLKALYYLESSIGSRYTSETTSAVRMFQRTAGLPETGRATQSVLRALFASNAPEAPGYITLQRGDESSRVQRLQLRLQQLGYFNGSVNGYFGRSTKDAVILFQRRVGLKPTGVATVHTQQLLFADDAPVYVPPTVIGTPVIRLDAYDYIENDIYYISDTSSPTGYITFSWYTEGSVASYNVRISDATGAVYVNNSTMLTLTGVSVSTLKYDVPYRLQITAYPADGDNSHITVAAATFMRIQTAVAPMLGSVGTPVISIDTVARTENDVCYVVPGDIIFHWFADGQVASYQVEIRNESDSPVFSVNTTDLQAAISASALNQGEIYTIFVYAIPANGTLSNARVKFMRFAVPVIELPSPDPTPVPTPTPEPTPEPTPVPATEPTPESSGDPTPEPSAEPTPESSGDPTPEPAVTEAPKSVTVPVISLNSEVADENGVWLVTEPNIYMSWFSEGDVEGYYVELVDASGKDIASTTTTNKNFSEQTGGLTPGEVYTLNVTAIPAGGDQTNGASNSTRFIVQAAETPSPEPTAQPDEEPSFEPTAQPAEEPSSEPTAQPDVEPPAEPPATPGYVFGITAEPTAQPDVEPTPVPAQDAAEETPAEPTATPGYVFGITAEPTSQATEETPTEPTATPGYVFGVTAEPTAQPDEESSPDFNMNVQRDGDQAPEPDMNMQPEPAQEADGNQAPEPDM